MKKLKLKLELDLVLGLDKVQGLFERDGRTKPSTGLKVDSTSVYKSAIETVTVTCSRDPEAFMVE